MKYLLYPEVPLHGDHVQQRLGALDTNADVTVTVPIRALSGSEREFLEVEHATGQAGESPEGVFALRRLREAVNTLQRAGFAGVEGVIVAESSPVDAIEAAVEKDRYDAVVVVTEPVGVARWIRLDLAHRIERHVDKPVIHIELKAAR